MTATAAPTASRFLFTVILTICLCLPAMAETLPNDGKSWDLVQIKADQYFKQVLGDSASLPSCADCDAAGRDFTLSPTLSQALGGNATVAILDGQTDISHSDLGGRVVRTGLDVGNSNHGTHVAGIIGASLNGSGVSGVAPLANMLNYPVFNSSGQWLYPDITAILQDAVSNGASAANMSFGPSTAADLAFLDTLMAIESVRGQMLVTKAAGNDGQFLGNEYVPSGTVLDNLIVVGAMEPDGTRAYYSNRPGNACIVDQTTGACTVKIRKIFLVAPGGSLFTGVQSTLPGDAYGGMSGTSMAAPQVAGAIALLQSRWPFLKLQPTTTRDILLMTADRNIKRYKEGDYGQGLLDVVAAMSPVGTLTIGGGGSSGGGGGGGGKGGGPKPRAWALEDTRLHTGRALSAVAESKATIAALDDFSRDFTYPVSALVAAPSTPLPSKLERMITGSDTAFDTAIDWGRPGSLTLRETVSGGPGSTPRWSASFSLPGSDVTLHMGEGKARTMLYPNVVAVGADMGTDASETGLNPVLGLVEDGAFSGASFGDTGRVRFVLGFAYSDRPELATATAYEGRAMIASAHLPAGPQTTLGATLTRLEEDGGLLGARGTGAFSTGDGTITNAATLALNWKGHDGYALMAAATVGLTEGGSDNGVVRMSSGLPSDAWHLGVRKTGLRRDDDRLTLSLSQPLRMSGGSMTLTSASGLDAQGTMHYTAQDIGLEPSGREIDLQLEYATPLGDGASVSGFGYVARDAGHVAGQSDAGLGMRYKLRF